MSGGLFGRPFVLNIKCVIFSLIIMFLFLYKPDFKNNYSLYFTLFLIFVISYVCLAWYDYYYDCSLMPLKRGGGITSIFKPPAHAPKKQKVNNEAEHKRHKIIIYLSHIVFIAPLIAYIAIMKNKAKSHIYPLLGALAAFTLMYHGYELINISHIKK
jgi:predicted neutral ceramidase superfamily lipid hydrolase